MVLALPFCSDCPTHADLFRWIFRDHFDRWCDLRLDNDVPADRHAYVLETVQRMTALPCAAIRKPVMPATAARAPTAALTFVFLFPGRPGVGGGFLPGVRRREGV